MAAETALFDSRLAAVADWLGSNPRAPALFDDAAFVDIADALGSKRTVEFRTELWQVSLTSASADPAATTRTAKVRARRMGGRPV